MDVKVEDEKVRFWNVSRKYLRHVLNFPWFRLTVNSMFLLTIAITAQITQ